MIGYVMWGNRGPRNLIATILGCGGGAVKPYVGRLKQVATNWKTVCTKEWMQTNRVQ